MRREERGMVCLGGALMIGDRGGLQKVDGEGWSRSMHAGIPLGALFWDRDIYPPNQDWIWSDRIGMNRDSRTT